MPPLLASVVGPDMTMRLVRQALVGCTAGSVQVTNLVHSNWKAVPSTLGVLSLAFVFQNVVPVVCSRLEVRTLQPQTRCACSC